MIFSSSLECTAMSNCSQNSNHRRGSPSYFCDQQFAQLCISRFSFGTTPIDLSPNYVIPVRARNALWYLWSRVAMLAVVLKLFCLSVS